MFPADVSQALVNVLPKFDPLIEVTTVRRREEERDGRGRENGLRDGAAARHGPSFAL